MERLVDAYLNTAMNIVYDDESTQYGIVDIGYNVDNMECLLYTHFVYNKKDFGFTISIVLKDPYAHQFRVEQFDRWDYQIECDNSGTILHFYNKEDDNWFDKEVEVTRSYSRIWKVTDPGM